MKFAFPIKPMDDVWRPWFAWFPVGDGSGTIIWLETVERKQGGLGGARWRYRERGDDETVYGRPPSA